MTQYKFGEVKYKDLRPGDIVITDTEMIRITQMGLDCDCGYGLLKCSKFPRKEIPEGVTVFNGRFFWNDCPSCMSELERGNTFFPPHNASPNCKSGGYNHCSCDVCF